MDPKKFAAEICKTGFVLENQIAQTLKAAGWTVISNKYYVDDFEESVREIDLIAYRVSKVKHLDVYTALIISCKKSESNAWALLAREINLKDPNSDWWPLHTWSNDKVLQHQLSESGAVRRYHEQVCALGVTDALSVPSVEVFAFQEMDGNSGKPKNDKPIFSAVTSLMKAQAYELSALPLRRKAPAIYQFNLLSVVDAELLRLMFVGPDITCSSLETEHYLARYIVKKKETFSRIRFIKASKFGNALQDYARLHQANCKWFGTEFDAFYIDVVKDFSRTEVLIEEFSKKIGWFVRTRLEKHFGRATDFGKPSLFWSDTTNDLVVNVIATVEVFAYLNEDGDIKKHVAQALREIYRFEGGFRFDDDIPF